MKNWSFIDEKVSFGSYSTRIVILLKNHVFLKQSIKIFEDEEKTNKKEIVFLALNSSIVLHSQVSCVIF